MSKVTPVVFIAHFKVSHSLKKLQAGIVSVARRIQIDIANDAFLPVLDYLAIEIPESIPSLFAGEKKSFYCFVEGLSPPTVRWLMNNDVLSETKSQRDKHVNLTLDFPELDLHHTGNYTCEASNYNITTKKRSILVTVTCKHLLLTRLFHTCSL